MSVRVSTRLSVRATERVSVGMSVCVSVGLSAHVSLSVCASESVQAYAGVPVSARLTERVIVRANARWRVSRATCRYYCVTGGLCTILVGKAWRVF